MSFQPIDNLRGARLVQQDLEAQRRVILADQEIKKRLRKRAQRRKELDPMSDVKDRIKQLQERAKRAAGRAAAAERNLYRHGVPLYDYERHQQMVAEIRKERDRVLAEVEREAQEIVSEQQERIKAANEFSRDSVLSSTERSEVRDRLPFIEAEVNGMGAGQLRRRLEAVTADGDKVERFCYWRAAVAKRSQVLERQEKAGIGTPAIGFGVELDSLDRSLFVEEFEKRVGDATEVRVQAQKVAQFAFTRRHNATSVATARDYAIDPVIERQRYEYGGRVPVSPLDNEDRTPAGAGGVANG